MTLLRTRIIPAVILAVVAGVAVFLFRPEPAASWLRVDAPDVLVVGQPFVATVTLVEPVDGAFLDFDLHGQDAAKQPLRCVAAGVTQRVGAGTLTYTFTLVLRERTDVARAHAVVYLSRSGQWSDAFRTARSDTFPVMPGIATGSPARVIPLVVRDQQSDPEIVIAQPWPLRAAIAGLWLAAAAVASFATRPAPGRPASIFAVLCLTLATWEALAAGPWIEDHGRSLIRAAGFYEDRAEFQKWTTAALVALVGGAAGVGLRRSRPRIPGLALVGVALYAAVSVAGILSFHEIDRVLALGVGPMPLAGVLRASAAGLALAGALTRARNHPAVTIRA